jgi:hypothetical protein
MPHGDAIEIASAPVDSVQAGRAARTRVVESAWVARRDHSWSESLASGDVLNNAMEAYESRKTLASLYAERL